jgi:hypothetical protein
MVVNGKDLRITRNLSCALLQLRRADRLRELWIDALCINQSSAEEKTQQVRKMHRIYSLASRVIIWLGESDSYSDLAMDCLQRVRSMQFHAFMTINDERKRHLQKLFEENVEPISALRSRAWWNRVWTVQEGLAANKHSVVQCGHRKALWEKVLLALTCLDASYPTDARVLDKPTTSDFMRVYYARQASQAISLEDLIYASSHRQASDPRDHIYALLGLAEKSFYDPFEPDYTQSPMQTFQRAVVSIIKTRQDLHFLINAVLTNSKSRLKPEPSWSHDFSNETCLVDYSKQHLSFRYSMTHDGATTGRAYSGIRHNAIDGTITLGGTIAGIVGTTQLLFGVSRTESTTVANTHCAVDTPNPLEDIQTPLSASAEVDILHHRDGLLASMRVFATTAQEAWRTRLPLGMAEAKLNSGDAWRVAANGRHDTDLIPKVPPEPLGLGNKYGLLAHYAKVDTKEKEAHAEIARIAYDSITKLQSRHSDQEGCLFTTTSGYVGSGPKKIRSGDIVCILFGCAMPLVMRPRNNGTHRIIGAVYVDDIMSGEFLRDKASYTDSNFIIR